MVCGMEAWGGAAFAASALGEAAPDCARFKGSDDLETFRARLEKLSENSIQARLALKYRDAPAQQEDDAVLESKYHHNNKVTFYFERHPTHHYGE